MTPHIETTVTVDDRVTYRDQDMPTTAASHPFTWRECSRCGVLFIGEGRDDDCGRCS
jgi:hypothetical protein